VNEGNVKQYRRLIEYHRAKEEVSLANVNEFQVGGL